MISRLFSALVFALSIPAYAFADEGYVYRGDLNLDGIEDTIESGPQTLFGNAGGPFIVTLSQGNHSPKKYVVELNPRLVTVERVKHSNMTRLWSYWHISASEGLLYPVTLDNKPKSIKSITLYPGDYGSKISNILLDTLFAEDRRISFQKVTRDSPPPRPDGTEWGK